MRLIAAAFIVLHALAALAMLALSVHGPAWLPLGALVYLATLAGLVLWATRRRSWSLLLAVGVLFLAAPPAIFLLLDQLEQRRHEAQVAATRVSEVHDEPILSAAGRPIGVRLSFLVSVPHSGSYAISPSLYGSEGLYMNAAKRSVDGREESWDYEAGRAHRQAAELYPPLLMRSPDGTRCLSRFVPTLPGRGEPAPLRIVISETAFDGRTSRAYNLPQLYRNVMAEGLPVCKAGL